MSGPTSASSVLLYLVILFAAAFLLLLMSYFMQQRANQEAMDKLEQTSDSATQSLENILQENETLKVENEALSQQVAQLQEALEDAESASDDEAALVQLEALCYLNQVRALYNDGRYSDAGMRRPPPRRSAEAGGMEGVLGTVADGLTDQQRQDYNPLEPTSPSWSGWADCSRETASGQSPLHFIRRCAPDIHSTPLSLRFPTRPASHFSLPIGAALWSPAATTRVAPTGLSHTTY